MSEPKLDLDALEKLAREATPGEWVPNSVRYYMTAPVQSEEIGRHTSREVPVGKCFMCEQGRPLHKVVTYYGRENGGHVHYDEGGKDVWAITTPDGEHVMSNNDADGGGFSRDVDLLFCASANPQTILALLAERRRLKQQVEKVREHVCVAFLPAQTANRFNMPQAVVTCACERQFEAASDRLAINLYHKHLSDQQIADLDAGDAKQRVREKSK